MTLASGLRCHRHMHDVVSGELIVCILVSQYKLRFTLNRVRPLRNEMRMDHTTIRLVTHLKLSRPAYLKLLWIPASGIPLYCVCHIRNDHALPLSTRARLTSPCSLECRWLQWSQFNLRPILTKSILQDLVVFDTFLFDFFLSRAPPSS